MPTALRAGRFLPSTALAQSLTFDDTMMRVHLIDGRIVSVPLVGFPILNEANPDARNKYEIGGGGVALHWPDLDEDLSIAGIMGGVDPKWS